MMKNTATAASLAYVDRMFKYLASWRYFLDRLDKLLAFESNAVKEEEREILISSWKYFIKCMKS